MNGLEGRKAFFPEKSFDVVVACHVLEHIPDEDKEDFLDELCSLAGTAVVLLGPVEHPLLGHLTPRLIYRITRASWAREHIDCHLPTLEMLKDFAIGRSLDYKITPNGARATAFWMVLAGYFARTAGRTNELEKAIDFSNRHLNDNIFNPNEPNDYIVEYRLDSS